MTKCKYAGNCPVYDKIWYKGPEVSIEEGTPILRSKEIQLNNRFREFVCEGKFEWKWTMSRSTTEEERALRRRLGDSRYYYDLVFDKDFKRKKVCGVFRLLENSARLEERLESTRREINGFGLRSLYGRIDQY